MGAIQAQDYSSALWAIGLRSEGTTQSDVLQAVAEAKFVRTWPMRGTLHFVASSDVHWMLELLTPRVLAAHVRRAKQLGLDDTTLARCHDICVEALRHRQQLTRECLLAKFESDGVKTDAQRGYHILWRLAQQRVICFGPRSGKSATFVLLSEWLPNEQPIRREEALAKLADRYFASHGPATMQDFMWWSGLTTKDTRQAIQAPDLSRQTLPGAEYWSPTRQCHELGVVSPMAHFLPAFDEYLLGYRNRDAVVEPKHATKIAPGGGVFRPILVINGRVAGTWTRTVKAAGIIVDVTVFQKLTKQAEDAVAAAASRYSGFLEKPVKLHFLPRR